MPAGGGEKTQIQRVNLQLNAYADKLRAAEAKLFLFLKKSPADRCNYVHREEGTDRADTVALINNAQQHRRRRGRTRAGSKTSGSIKQMHEAVARGQLKGAFSLAILPLTMQICRCHISLPPDCQEAALPSSLPLILSSCDRISQSEPPASVCLFLSCLLRRTEPLKGV